MPSRIIPVTLVAACSVLVMLAALATRTAAQNPMGDADAEPAPFNPQMAAMMMMLIQPRHAKLGLAGKEENWPLAGYALKELKQGFVITARAVPRWKGLPVPDLFDVAVSAPLALLDFAIKANEPRQFGEGYARLTAGCNACHGTTDHPFVVIKAPDSARRGISPTRTSSRSDRSDVIRPARRPRFPPPRLQRRVGEESARYRTIGIGMMTLSNQMLWPRLRNSFDHPPADLGADRLPEALSDHHALLGDDRQLLHELLAGRTAVERRDLAQLVGSEIAGVDGGDLIDDLIDAGVHAFEQQRHDRIIVALDFRTILDDGGLEAVHDRRHDGLEIIGGAHGDDEIVRSRHRLRRRRLRAPHYGSEQEGTRQPGSQHPITGAHDILLVSVRRGHIAPAGAGLPHSTVSPAPLISLP